MCTRLDAMREVRSAACKLSFVCLAELLKVDTRPLLAATGEDFAGLSRMLGRNPAYIQQFVRRGVPKRLKEEERRLMP